MARSTYIYIVRDPDFRILYAGTVKHELVRWLVDHPGLYVITRHPDGHTRVTPVILNPTDLEPAI